MTDPHPSRSRATRPAFSIRWLRPLAILAAVPLMSPGVSLADYESNRSPAGAQEDSSSEDWVSKKRRRKGKRRKGKRKKGKSKEKEESMENLFDANAPQPEEGNAADEPPPPPEAAPVLDLSNLGSEDAEAAKEELLNETPEEPKASGKKKPRSKDGSFDFGTGFSVGDGELEFGDEVIDFDVDGIDLDSEENRRFEEAMDAVSEEDYVKAAQDFRFFLEDEKYADFKEESEYQLAKSLYKLDLVDPALKRFRAILEQGVAHRRYRKSIEWLFFISRKMADETPVLRELARFRGVKFPKAYRDEYSFLLAEYLFIQAQRFELQKLQEEEMARRQKETAAFNFDALDQAAEGGSGFNFDGGEGSFNFGGEPEDAGGGGGFNFGGGGDEGGGEEGGGFNFGGGDEGGGDEGGGGFNFGGDGDDGGALDFGGGGDDGTAADAPEAAPMPEAAPTNKLEAIRQALDLVKEVDAEGKWAARAKYLEGLLHYMNGDLQDAVNAFQETVRVLNPRGGRLLDPKLREQAFLSLARIHYGVQQFNKSAFYYDRIDRDSENWLTALFEASWAWYQRGDFEKALGNLLTLHSPFFEREYFPESQIVKAIIYFEACRYGETREIVDDFLARYTKVKREIEKIAESKEEPERLYERIATLETLSSENEDDATARVVNLALSDTEIRTAQAGVGQAKDQLDILGSLGDEFKGGLLGRELALEIQELIAERVRNAGEVTKEKFNQELFALKSLLAQAVSVKIEVVRAERTAIESRMRNEETGDKVIPAVARTVVDDERLYWPFEGEYWRDELGTYELDFSQCRRLASR